MAKSTAKNTPMGNIRFFGDQMFVCNFTLWITRHSNAFLMAKNRDFEIFQCYNSVTRPAKNLDLERFLKKRIERLYIRPFGQRGFSRKNSNLVKNN